MGSRWQARYRDETGREHARKFAKRVDAQRWLDEVPASVVTGQYVDPGAGKITFSRFYAEWSKRQVWVSSTREGADHAAASVTFGDVPMSSLRRSHIENWVKTMSASLAPTTIKTRFTHVRAAIRGAVADRVIATDPC